MDSENFKTSDLCLAATLMYTGSELIGCTTNSQGKVVFDIEYLNDVPSREFLIKYMNHEILVSPMKYMSYHRFLKKAITQQLGD